MKRLKTAAIYAAVIFPLLTASSHSFAKQNMPQTAHPAPSSPSPSPGRTKTVPFKKIAPGVFRLGDILINKNNMSISFPASVDMDKGLLEYLLVHSDGKTYESLLKTEVEPYDLQLAFLLLGFKPTKHPIPYQGSSEQPKGERVEITINYVAQKNVTRTIHSSDWIVKTEGNSKKNITPLEWVFTGSMINGGQFAAQREGSIVAIYHDPVAIIDNDSRGGDSDEIWYVKKGSVPPPGTPINITITKAGKPKIPDGDSGKQIIPTH